MICADIDIYPATSEAITVSQCSGIPVVVTVVPTGDIEIKGVLGIPGKDGKDGKDYDQTSPTDGIAIIGDTLRIDIASLPLAD